MEAVHVLYVGLIKITEIKYNRENRQMEKMPKESNFNPSS